ncbi:MAG: endonuclease NucS [Acidilobaceae archaeon]
MEKSRVKLEARPSLEKAKSLLSSYLPRRPLVVMIASCETEYEGRGASRASRGDRVVMIKPDGSIIVHSSRGFKPLNWQPDTSSVAVLIEGGELVVKAFRRTAREVLVLRCSEIEVLAILEAPVEGDYYMYLSEREIVEVIKDNPWLVEEGFEVLDSEKPLELGVADIYGRDGRGRPVLVEVKRVKATEEAVRQLHGYLEALKARGVEARGVLLAPGATENALRLAALYGIEVKHLDLRRARELAFSRARRTTLSEYLSSAQEERGERGRLGELEDSG